MTTLVTSSTSTPVRCRAETHSQLRQLAARHRITVIDALELAVEHWASLPVEQRREHIDREPRRKRRTKS